MTDASLCQSVSVRGLPCLYPAGHQASHGHRGAEWSVGRECFTVAALFVDPNGVYANLPGVEVWGEDRDARLYDGPWPVVAHPPCNRWAKLGPRERRGEDGGCFAAALAAVRRFGGVLEHPAESRAWRAFGLARPYGPWWSGSLDDPGWVAAVDQWHYGFPTRKPTWLYCVGLSDTQFPAFPAGAALAVNGCDALWSTERSKTPPAFRDVLLGIACGVTLCDRSRAANSQAKAGA